AKFKPERTELPAYRADDLDDVPKSATSPNRMANFRRIRDAGKWHEAVAAYLACINYTDTNIGRVLDALDASPHRDNTIVVLWGDHGWHLGEKDHWRKFALWEEATRMPYIWIVPGMTKAGGVCNSPVDLMSVYPTLCELASIEKPGHLEGLSINTLLS